MTWSVINEVYVQLWLVFIPIKFSFGYPQWSKNKTKKKKICKRSRKSNTPVMSIWSFLETPAYGLLHTHTYKGKCIYLAHPIRRQIVFWIKSGSLLIRTLSNYKMLLSGSEFENVICKMSAILFHPQLNTIWSNLAHNITAVISWVEPTPCPDRKQWKRLYVSEWRHFVKYSNVFFHRFLFNTHYIMRSFFLLGQLHVSAAACHWHVCMEFTSSHNQEQS